ncbi:uncharacterized protein LOC125637119 [Caretta caretta]|uniref:uncharacterized protein LOC125637119 n=1 Tax=Caretta caretta TaxID=8467 RepID=UPI0020952900|nr:uncharacterized protein LOC125637119 [Caretta caretta]
MDTCKGRVSRNWEEDFVDEEEEEEENAQQASGESVLPSSQDLFITLEPIPSQGGIPDPEGGEGTSGANVSILPLSSLSLRLSQIRRRKKCTRDDMFSEFMQSSCTDRAQLNAWRHSVVESRKALHERDEKRHGGTKGHAQASGGAAGKPTRAQTAAASSVQPPALLPKFHILLTQMPKNAGSEAPGTQPLHSRGWPKQQKAIIQTV